MITRSETGIHWPTLKDENSGDISLMIYDVGDIKDQERIIYVLNKIGVKFDSGFTDNSNNRNSIISILGDDKTHAIVTLALSVIRLQNDYRLNLLFDQKDQPVIFSPIYKNIKR